MEGRTVFLGIDRLIADHESESGPREVLEVVLDPKVQRSRVDRSLNVAKVFPIETLWLH